MFSANSKIKRIYCTPKDSIYAHRFFDDLTSGYSFTLGKKGENNDFFSFEPDGCQINNYLKRQNYHSSYEIEQLVSRIAYSLMKFGRAYMYIHPDYSVKQDNDGIKTQVLSSFEIREIKGVIKRQTKEGCIFCGIGFNFEVKEIQMTKNQLVLFDIEELGFSKKYFPNILKKLSKCYITKNTDMMVDNSNLYDYTYYAEKKKYAELKIVRKIGWSFGTDKLSDSYILYKKIQEDELRTRFLEYIVERINEGLHNFVGDNAGKLIARINRKDYKQLWNDYTEGRITGTELTNILYKN